MDLDFRTVFSIVELIQGVKATYQSFQHNEKPVYRNRPQYQRQNRLPPRKPIPRRPPNKSRGFWI